MNIAIYQFKPIDFIDTIGYRLETEQQKEWLLKAIRRRVDRVIDDMVVVLANQFRAQHKEVNKKLSNLKNKKHFNKKKWDKNIADAVKPMIFEAAKDGYLAAYNSQKGGYLYSMEFKAAVDLATSIGFVADNTNVSAWLDEYTMVFSSNINTTIQKRLNGIIKTEIAEGGTIEVIRRNIQDKVNAKYSNIYGIKGSEKLTARGARRMAQTEVNGAQNAGHLAGLKDSGIVKFKAWLSTRNVKVRDTHSAADKRYTRIRGIGIDDLFSVGNAKLSAPGVLVSGDVGERINCRCSLLAAKKGSKGKLPKGELKPLLPTLK